DLFYRISTVEIRLPPLRERQCDIPLLAGYFMRSYSSQYKKGIKGIRPELMKQWQAYEWPGNIRELQNTVHQAVLMCKGEELGFCGPEDEAGRSQSPAEPSGRQQDAFCPEHYATLKELSAGALSYYEKQRIREALADSKGNKSKAARDLAITRKTLLRKIKDYGIGARG
ncbi:MAG: hypothetical protein LLF89_01125, partial [Spirochaetaceae bacterium]|nr:hypothetical protein [Spirochaetaceae bacterium]